MIFQGDQGRDALIVSKIWREQDLVFIGPVTSVGNMYLGPFYYYFMLPFLWLSYPHPIGPTIAVALANVILIALTYTLGKRMVGAKAGLWASFFTTFSLIAINYSRFSWNPNLSALFSILTLYFIFTSLTKKTSHWLWVGLLSGILIQLHYVNLIVVAVGGIFWLRQWWSHDRNWRQKQKFWRWSLLAISIFLFTLIPLLLFDLKHNWLNTQAVFNIFSQESSLSSSSNNLSLATNLYYSFTNVYGRIGHLFTSLILPQLETLNHSFINVYYLRVGLGLFILAAFAILFWKTTHPKYTESYRILLTTAFLSIFSLAFYRHSVFDHYLLFFLPVIFLILGCLLSAITNRFLYCFISLLTIVIFFWGNYRPNFYQPLPSRYENFADIVTTLLATIKQDNTFSLILINQSGDLLGEQFRYIFTTQSQGLVPMSQSHEADYLFVIDETKTANLYNINSAELIVFRNLPEATYSAIPYRPDGPLLYRFEKGNSNL
jgi:4-amino-4-deoxy-L-arabinose transferase-like glycosyltransferase